MVENRLEDLPKTLGAGMSMEERFKHNEEVRLERRLRRKQEVLMVGGAVHLHIEEQLRARERGRGGKRSGTHKQR